MKLPLIYCQGIKGTIKAGVYPAYGLLHVQIFNLFFYEKFKPVFDATPVQT